MNIFCVLGIHKWKKTIPGYKVSFERKGIKMCMRCPKIKSKG